MELSGSFGALMVPSIGIGFFSAYALSYILKKSYNPSEFWNITFGFPVVLLVIQLILILKVHKN